MGLRKTIEDAQAYFYDNITGWWLLWFGGQTVHAYNMYGEQVARWNVENLLASVYKPPEESKTDAIAKMKKSILARPEYKKALNARERVEQSAKHRGKKARHVSKKKEAKRHSVVTPKKKAKGATKGARKQQRSKKGGE